MKTRLLASALLVPILGAVASSDRRHAEACVESDDELGLIQMQVDKNLNSEADSSHHSGHSELAAAHKRAASQQSSERKEHKDEHHSVGQHAKHQGEKRAEEQHKDGMVHRLHKQAKKEFHMLKKQVLTEGNRRGDGKDPPPIGPVSLVTLGGFIAVVIFYYGGVHMVGPGEEEDKEVSRHMIDLVACFFLIIVFFCSYGIAQEYIMTQEYGGELFPNTTFLIFCNRIVICFVATTSLYVAKESVNMAVAKWTVIPAATVLTSSWAQYECLHYVTFPTQVVFKSAKIVPTMLINTLINRVIAPWTDYVLALVITCAVAGFSLVAEEANGADSNSFYGIVLLCLFLLCDALTSNTEKWVYNKDKAFSNRQMMMSIGFVTLIYSGITTACAPGGFNRVFTFISSHPECLPQIVMLACNSTLGQYVIYYTVRTHGPVQLAVMMTVRQIISVYISAVLYHHDIPILAGVFAAIAFGAVLWKPFYKYFSGQAFEKGHGGPAPAKQADDASGPGAKGETNCASGCLPCPK